MRVRVAHASLQFSDNPKQHTADIEKIFHRLRRRRVAWIMGTESGPGANNTSSELVRVARLAGYKPWVPSEQSNHGGRATDAWLAVRNDLVLGDWERGFEPVIPGSHQLYEEAGHQQQKGDPRWGPKGVVHVKFKSLPQIGNVGLAAAHHLTKGQVDGPRSVIDGIDHHKWNEKLDDAIGKWLSEAGKGKDLAFASFDRNASDKRNDANVPHTTTLADELKKWQNTGHGDIDWILSLNKDGRVEGVDFKVLDDKEFFLNTDHFYCEGTFDIKELRTR